MKKIILLGTVLLLGLGTAQAQGNGKAKGQAKKEQKQQQSPEEKAKNRTAKLSEKIGLSGEQQGKVYEAKLTRIKAVEEAKKTTPPNKEAMKAANKQYAEAMKSILSPEQQEKLQALRKEHKAKKAEKKGSKGKPAPVKEEDKDEDLED